MCDSRERMGELMAGLFGKLRMTEECEVLNLILSCACRGKASASSVSWSTGSDFARLRQDLNRRQQSFYVWWMWGCWEVFSCFFSNLFVKSFCVVSSPQQSLCWRRLLLMLRPAEHGGPQSVVFQQQTMITGWFVVRDTSSGELVWYAQQFAKTLSLGELCH